MQGRHAILVADGDRRAIVEGCQGVSAMEGDMASHVPCRKGRSELVHQSLPSSILNVGVSTYR